LRLVDLQDRRSVRHLQVHGKGSKIRYVPLHPAAASAIAVYLEAAGHGDDKPGPLFRPVSNNARGPRAITPDGVYKVLIKYAGIVGIDVDGFGPHALRATAATNALEHDADIARCSNGWGTRTSRPRACTIGARCVPRIAQLQPRRSRDGKMAHRPPHIAHHEKAAAGPLPQHRLANSPGGLPYQPFDLAVARRSGCTHIDGGVPLANDLTTTTRLPGTGLTTADFHHLTEVPPALTWFANIDNPQTRRAYQNDVEEFMAFAGLQDPHAFRQVGRAHVLAWRRDLERRDLGAATIRRKLSALSSLFDALCEANAVQGNPVDGVKRPKVASQEGSTPAIGDHQARAAGGAGRLDPAGPARSRDPGDIAVRRGESRGHPDFHMACRCACVKSRAYALT
jgi:site-specific recombinase XerD